MTTDPFTKGTKEPDVIVGGVWCAWTKDLDFDDTGRTVAYYITCFTGGSEQQLVAGSYVNGTWEFELTSAITSSLSSGEQRWDLRVTRTSDSESVSLEDGSFHIFDSSDDRRSHAEIMLAKINSVIEGRADHDIESYTIKSRSITRMGVAELMKWRNYYLDEIARTGGSLTGQTSAKSNTVKVRFV